MRPYQLVRRAPAMAVLLVIAAIALALPGPAVHAEEPSAALLLLVAQEYARTGDADVARAALAGWDAAEVDAALARAAETGDMEAAAGLQALRDVLADDAAPFRPQTLLTDVWVRIGLVVSGTLVLTAGLAALLPAGPVPRPTTNRRKDAATDALAGLTPEDLLRLLSLAEAGAPRAPRQSQRAALPKRCAGSRLQRTCRTRPWRRERASASRRRPSSRRRP